MIQKRKFFCFGACGFYIVVFALSHCASSFGLPSAVPMPTPGSSAGRSPYLADLKRRINGAWFPPCSGGKGKRIKFAFTIKRDGSIENLHLLISSGVNVADSAAKSAIQNAAPFRPLPEYAPNEVDVEFTFDYGKNHADSKQI